MNKQLVFIIIILLILIYINIFIKENFYTKKYNIILINHKNYQLIIVKNINNTIQNIYKIYKN